MKTSQSTSSISFRDLGRDDGRPRTGTPALLIVAPGAVQRQVRMLLHPREFAIAEVTQPPLTIESAAEICRDLERAPDLVLMAGGKELYAAGGSAELLRTLLPESRLVVVSSCSERETITQALRAGAWALVCEERLGCALAPVLRAVNAGQLCVPGSLTQRIDPRAFSVREREVLDLVTRGLTNSQIARRLFLSESTVKSHLASSFRKLGLRSRAEAAAAWGDVLDDEIEQREALERIAAHEARLTVLSERWHSVPGLLARAAAS